MATTLGQIVTLALTDCGAFGQGQTASATDQANALLRAQMMMSQWARHRWFVYTLVDTGFACTTAAASYTLGPGQNFNIERIDRIDAAYIQQTGTSQDWALKIITSREEFIRIQQTVLQGDPTQYLYYDSNFPDGTLYPWPLPSTGYSLHILTKVVLQEFVALSDTILLPPEYFEAIYYNLCVRFRAAYRLPADEVFDTMAKETLGTLQEANQQSSYLPIPKNGGTTVADLVNLAIEDSGAFAAPGTPGSVPGSQQGPGRAISFQVTMDVLWRLNMMVAQWNRRRWLIYNLVDTAATCTGALSYTVGPAQQFNIARPDQIEMAYIRQLVPTNPTPIDWPLELITSHEDYARIAIKTLAAAPSEFLFYDSGWPTGLVYPWPVPNNQYELHLLTKNVISTFPTLATPINLPPEYFEAILLNLAFRVRVAYAYQGMPPKPELAGLAKKALDTIRGANFQVGRLRMPKGINRSKAYNIYSDQGG